MAKKSTRISHPVAGGDMALTIEERFWQYVDKEGPNGCWLWTGAKNPKGYGQFQFGGRWGSAHRYAYQRFVGVIPQGLGIDHLCRVRNCVNYEHLEPVTTKENTLRGISPSALNARKITCPRGHPLSGKNLYLRPSGFRCCRTCRQNQESVRVRQTTDSPATPGGE